MQFSFEVDPDLDMAIGLEADFVGVEGFGEISEMNLMEMPLQPTDAKPGSEDKVRMLSARYAAGVPLWHEDDCYDHGPGELSEFSDEFVDLDDEDVD